MTLVAQGLIRAPTVVGASRLRVNYHCNLNKEDVLSEAYIVMYKRRLLKTVYRDIRMLIITDMKTNKRTRFSFAPL